MKRIGESRSGTLQLTHGARRLNALFMLGFASLVFGCHRSEFTVADTTLCPPPEGTLVILDYTLNCLYVGDAPDNGCPEALPNDYFFLDTFICSERANGTNVFLQAVIDRYLEIDAGMVDASDANVEQISPGSTSRLLDLALDSGP